MFVRKLSIFQIALQNILGKKKLNGVRKEETREVNPRNLTTPPTLPSPSSVIGKDLLSKEGANGTIDDPYIMSENGTNKTDEDENLDGSSTIESEFGTFSTK